MKINWKIKIKEENLDEIAVQSLRCGMSIDDLINLFDNFNVKYSETDIQKISDYRQHIMTVTRSEALGF